MNGVNEHANALCQTSMDFARQWATLMLEGAQRMGQAQTESMRSMLSDATRIAADMATTRDPAQMFATWPRFVQDGARRSAESAGAVVSTAIDVQAGLLRLMQEAVPEWNRQIMGGVEDMARIAATAGGIGSIASVRGEAATEAHPHRVRRAA
jgi:phasin family protein